MSEYSHVAGLAQLPPEILSIITSSLNGFNIGRLWLSGNSMLMVRLESGGVTRFELALAQEFNTCWPKLISQFKRLEWLSIRPKSGNHRIWFRDDDLAGIAPTLKHLELEFDNLEFSLFGLPFVVSDPHPDPVWSPPTEGEFSLSPFPLATHFSCLETVIFQGIFKFPSILVPMLPSGLLSLSLPYPLMSASILQQLPPNLTHLELPQCSEIKNAEFGFPFPSHVTHLDLSELVFLHHMLPTSLPPSLTYLKTCMGQTSQFDPMVLRLPRTLTTLIDATWNLEVLPFNDVPPSLRHFNSQNRHMSLKMETLPSGLQTLVTTNVIGLTDMNASQLPSTLTRLCLFRSVLTEACLSSLPPCLRSLSIHTPFIDVGTPYPFMSCLEDLNVSDLDASALSYAPKLRSLTLTRFSSHSPPILRHLTSLTTLMIKFSDNPDDEDYPSSLTALTLPFMNSLRSFQQLPRGLTMLNISARCDVSDESIAHLPPGLTDLTIEENSSLSDSAIALLPRSLESLVLGSAKDITGNSLANLPSGLRHLSLTSTDLLTDTSVASLPHQLTMLELDDHPPLSNKCAKYLPRSLVCLNIFDACQLTSDCFHELPPRLELFTMISDYGWRASKSTTEDFLSSLLSEAE